MVGSMIWTTKELETLRSAARLGAEAIAVLLGRSKRSVVCKASESGVSLRRPGVRKGLRLGQPRRSNIRELIRDEALRAALSDGHTSTELTGSLAAEVSGTTELCPRCTSRPVTHRSTGLCEVCHFRGLAQQHRQRQAADEAKSEYYRERARALRRTKCEVCGDLYSPRLNREGRKSDRKLCPACRAAALA